MFDLAWSEIAVIAVVAVVVIGPKDLPDAVRGVAKGIQKLRRMAGEFQGHLDEVVREAKLEDVRDQIRDIRNFDFKGEIEKAVDADGSIRKTFNDDPFRAPPPPTSDAAPAMTATDPYAAPPVDATSLYGVAENTNPAPGQVAPAEVALDPITLQPITPPAPPIAAAPADAQPASATMLAEASPADLSAAPDLTPPHAAPPHADAPRAA